MEIHELVKRLGGEFVAGRAQVRMDGRYVVLARSIAGNLQMTPEGAELARVTAQAASPAAEPAPKPKPKPRGRPKKVEPAPAEEQLDLDLSILEG